MSASLNLICPLVFGFYRQAVTHKKVVLCFFAMSSSLMDDLNPRWLLRFNHDQAETAYIHIIPGCIQGTLFNFLAAALVGFHSIKNKRRQIPLLRAQAYMTTTRLSLRKDRLKTQRTWRIISLTLLSASCLVRGSLDC